MKERRELKACTKCGFVRRVFVRDRIEPRMIREYTTYADTRPTHEFVVVGESYNERCRACELEVQIRIYEHRIAKLREQVQKERARQARAPGNTRTRS